MIFKSRQSRISRPREEERRGMSNTSPNGTNPAMRFTWIGAKGGRTTVRESDVEWDLVRSASWRR